MGRMDGVVLYAWSGALLNLQYTFEGTDVVAIDLMKPYLDACIGSRVHFQFFHPLEMARQGHFMNDCIYQNGSQQAWMDEYLVIPGEVKYFDGGHILKEQGQNCRS